MLPQAARPRGRRGTASTRFALASLLVVTALSGACTREPERGAVISAVEPAAAGARAGLAVGETVTAWTGDGAEGGPIAGPLSLLRVEIDEAPRGAVVLTVRGRSGERRVRLATGHWGLETVPAGAPEVTTDPALRAVAWETEGLALGRAGELTAARHALERALELRRGLAPESPAVARSLVHLADVDYRRQDPHGMELAERGVAAFRRFPAPLETAWALRVLANFAYVLGDLDRADRLYREALDLRLPLEPDGREGSILDQDLGLIAHDRGFLDEAERRYRRSFETYLRTDPEGEDVAFVSNYLGILAKDKGSFEEARSHYERALAIFRRVRADGVEVAGCLNNLGNLALVRGDLVAAERFHREALARRQAASPESVDVASSLHNVGRVVRALGRLDEATQLLERALAMKERLVPHTLLEASTLFELGEVARTGASWARAEDFHARALALRRRLAPGSRLEAESLFALGRVALATGRSETAETLWRRAIGEVEARRQTLRFSSDDKSRFVAPFYGDTKRLAALLRSTGRTEEAFTLLESARARALRLMMEQRGTPRLRELAPELAAERYRLEAELAGEESSLERLDPAADPEAAAEALRSVRELEGRLARLDDRIRLAVPDLAALHDPEPMTPGELAAALGEGSLLLSYAVGDEVTLLFTLAGGREPVLRSYEIQVGASELERRIGILRALVERGRHGGGAPEPALLHQAATLYRLLLTPAREELEVADRWLVVGDGPLFSLPFAALVRGARKPIAVAQSGTVFARLHGRPRTPLEAAKIVAFGNPEPLAEPSSPLPWARRELERVAELFGERATVFYGRGATEERVRATAGEADYLHFATHAVLDRRLPLESALALALPGGRTRAASADDGSLRGWEIAEQLDLHADLVTLSACSSALGGELAGEGITGLARAFQYAGARSLLVSLWDVSDRSTAELMERFYEGLRRGESKSGALLAAQASLLSQPQTAHPFHWAAFELLGDWE